jgi:plasmid stabilization system protein ParE
MIIKKTNPSTNGPIGWCKGEETNRCFVGSVPTDLERLTGRPLHGRLRELVISRGKTGNVASYFVHHPSGNVLVLRIRHQKERGL